MQNSAATFVSKIILGLLLASCLLLVPAWQSSLIPHTIEVCRTDPTTDQTDCLISATPRVVLSELRKLFDAETLAALFTGLLAISTAFLWDATRRLHKAGARQIHLVREAADRQFVLMRDANAVHRLSADAATASARAALESVAMSQDTAKRQLRAYVTAHTVTYSTREGRTGLEAVVEILNTGATPAYGFNQSALMTFADYPLKQPLRNVMEQFKSRSILGPQASQLAIPRLPRFLNKAETDALVRGQKAIYVHGGAEYVDAFGEPRSLKFCHYVRGHSHEIGAFKAYHEGNEAD